MHILIKTKKKHDVTEKCREYNKKDLSFINKKKKRKMQRIERKKVFFSSIKKKKTIEKKGKNLRIFC